MADSNTASRTIDPAQGEEHAQIQSVVDTYLAALRGADAELFRTAFHADSAVVHCSSTDATLVTSPLESFIDEVVKLRQDHGILEEIPQKVAVDVADCIASVRLDFNLRLGADTFSGTDFFTLAKTGSRWIITHKLYCM